MGWMFLCFFLCAKESKKFCKVEPCKKGFTLLTYFPHFTTPYHIFLMVHRYPEAGIFLLKD